MTKLNWERTNLEKKVRSHGTEPAAAGNSAEMPLAWDDLLIDFDPDGNRRIYLDFLRQVVEAEILDKDFPTVPDGIRRFVEPLIDHYRGLLNWARRTREYERLRLEIVRKRADKLDIIRRRFLHKVAKFEVTGNPGLDGTEPPEEIKEETDLFPNLKDWAHSRREYKGIRKNAENHAKGHWKLKDTNRS